MKLQGLIFGKEDKLIILSFTLLLKTILYMLITQVLQFVTVKYHKKHAPEYYLILLSKD